MRDGLRAIVYSSVEALNDGNTDETLIKAITEQIVEDKLTKVCVVQDDLIVGHHSVTGIQLNWLNKEIAGVWVYTEGNADEWELIRCKVMEDAIKIACDNIGDAVIIDNGIVIQWDILDCGNAFYLEGESIKLVNTIEEETVCCCE